MIIRKKTFDSLIADRDHVKILYSSLLKMYNELVEQINRKGGTQFMNGTSAQFSQTEIKALIRLCHPDRHNGRQLAVDITAKLTSMVNKK